MHQQILTAPGPREWFATHLEADQARYDEVGAPQPERRWVDRAELLTGDAALLREAHERLRVDDGATPVAAAKWLAGWFGGSLATAVGHTLCFAAAGVVLDPARVRWGLHAEGWPERVDVGEAAVLVAPDHPWAGGPADAVADDAEIMDRALRALVAVVAPIVEACHGLARVGRPALWAEVSDGFGNAIGHRPALRGDPEVADVLRRLLERPGMPWRKTPHVEVREVAGGPTYLSVRGGCCLAYQCPVEEVDGSAPDPAQLAYLERFPEVPGEPRYCSTCSLRPLEDAIERQVHYIESERRVGG